MEHLYSISITVPGHLVQMTLAWKADKNRYVRGSARNYPSAPKFSKCANNFIKFYTELNRYISEQEYIFGRRYTSKDKAKLFLNQLDHECFKEAIVEISLNIVISTVNGDDNNLPKHLTLIYLPRTVQQQQHQKAIRVKP